jgi:sensor histidine kinase YesM
MSVTDNNKKNKFWNFSPGFIAVNLLITFAISFSACPSCFQSVEGFVKIRSSLILTLLLSTALSYGGSVVERYFDKRIPWIRFPAKRVVLETAVYMLYAFCVSYVLIVIFVLWIRPKYTLDTIPWKLLLAETRLPMTLALLISAILISRSFLLEWRKAAIETEQLKTERYARQYQSLKDQLNPHFLFNSLNVLSNLVYDNPDTAAKFIRQLSKIYRYVLDVQQEEMVSLERELEFAENYLALQKIRFEQGLQYSVTGEIKEAGFLPPLSLQLLLENAIKHNIASMADPLKIEIIFDGETIIVRNNLQLKSSLSEESTGVGLSNIRKRYELLSSENIRIQNDNGYFAVKLPLLKMDKAG